MCIRDRRSVAPHSEYVDRLTKKTIAPVTTTQIYWGAVPFVIIQIIMVGLLIAFPNLVTGGIDNAVKVDVQSIQLEAPPVTEQGAPADGKEETEEDREEREKEAEDDPAKALQQSINKGK